MSDPNLEVLRSAVKQSPDNIPLLQIFAKACIEAWNFDEARSTCEHIIKLDPSNSDALISLGEIAYRKGAYSQSLVILEDLESKQKLSPPGQLLLCKALVGMNNIQKAKEKYAALCQSNPEMVDKDLEEKFNVNNFESKQEQKSSQEKPNIALQTNMHENKNSDIDEMLDSVLENVLPDQKKITFKDVGGMDLVKEDIKMKILYPLKNPDIFKAYGKKTGGGILMYGPPGCGKTHISRAIAGEIDATYLSIGLHEILDMYIGNSEKNLHEIFELARIKKPSVLFLDEVDALAADRSMLKFNGARTLINQFLSEFDGVNSSNEGVLVIAATNAPWHLDSAFKRPGRFDKIIFVPPPDLQARKSILELFLKDKPTEGIDLDKIAGKTENFSGADLKAIVDTASEIILNQAMKENRVIPLTNKELQNALSKVKPSTRAWFESAKNYALFSNQNGFYDDIVKYLNMK